MAGGKSSRMGTNKALLPVGRETLIGKAVNTLKSLFPEIILVTNEPELYQDLGVKLIKDLIPGCGPLGGIHAALVASPYRYNFVVACDMPFLEPQLIRFMVEQAPGYDGVVPAIGGRFEPLHAVYAKSCLPPIEECLRNHITKIIAFYPAVHLRYLEADVLGRYGDLSKIFFNINTPADLAWARRQAGEETK